jgi:hypothetical protein
MKKKFCTIAAYLFIPILFIIAYFLFVQSQFICIPVAFTPSGMPMLKVMIEENVYFLQFDLGSKFPLSLRKDVLETINIKKNSGIAKWRDIKGNFYEEPSYSIPYVKIENLVLRDMIVRQESEAFRNNAILWEDKNNQQNVRKHVGCVGRPILEKTNLLLDLKNAKIIACNHKRQLRKMGFLLNDTVKVSFEEGTKGIIVNFDTDVGILRLGLDTGSTITLVRANRLQDEKCAKDERGFYFFTTQRFSIGNKNFGTKHLFLYDITSDLKEIDGMLGMDFLKKHVIYIDYKDKCIYIEDHNHQIPEMSGQKV